MCCSRPTIIGIDGVARKLVMDAKAGLFAEPENSDSFIEAVMQLKNDPEMAEQMGASGRKYVLEHFTREKLAGRYLEVVTDVAKGQSRGQKNGENKGGSHSPC
jgi:glycosyltransferase involved in cell wall biosynthesis